MRKTAGFEGEKKLKARKYLKELRKLQRELCRLQEWVKHKGLFPRTRYDAQGDRHPMGAVVYPAFG